MGRIQVSVPFARVVKNYTAECSIPFAADPLFAVATLEHECHLTVFVALPTLVDFLPILSFTDEDALSIQALAADSQVVSLL